jgi:hypothetical protein
MSRQWKRYTHFIERDDGNTGYSDYARQNTALKRHQVAMNDLRTVRSRVVDYGAAGEKNETLMEWRRPKEST